MTRQDLRDLQATVTLIKRVVMIARAGEKAVQRGDRVAAKGYQYALQDMLQPKPSRKSLRMVASTAPTTGATNPRFGPVANAVLKAITRGRG